jgi:hypothetical protein
MAFSGRLPAGSRAAGIAVRHRKIEFRVPFNSAVDSDAVDSPESQTVTESVSHWQIMVPAFQTLITSLYFESPETVPTVSACHVTLATYIFNGRNLKPRGAN